MLTYFIAVMVCWGGCLALYTLALQQEKFFRLNRFYLLLTLGLGLLIPAVSWWPAAAPALAPEWMLLNRLLPVVTVGAAAPPAEAGWSWGWVWTWLGALYFLGCGVMAARLLGQCWQLARLVHTGRSSRQPGGYTLVEHVQVTTPFSFLGYLFWNPALYEDAQAAYTIQVHERAHISQRHSLDLLGLEIIGLFFWWCPLWYAYGRALRNVHEFLADEAAIRHTNTRAYGQLLIRQCLNPGAPSLAHGLRQHAQLKNRIAMMTKNHSSHLALAKYLALLPLVAVLTVACAQTDKPVPAATEFMPVSQLVDTVITFDPATQSETVQLVRTDIFREAERMPVFGACDGQQGEALDKCSVTNLMTYIAGQLKYPEAARQAKLEGMVVSTFVVYSNGSVGAPEIKRSLSPECDAEVLRIIRDMPSWQPGEIDGKAVNVQMTLPIKYQLTQ